MGGPIAANLARAGLTVTVWNRTREKAEALARPGIAIAATPAEAARGAEAVGVIVRDDAAVEAVLEGPDGILAGLEPGALLVDMTTTSIGAKLRLAERVRAAGGRPVEAPVFGSRPQAEEGKLWPVVGASPEDYEAALDFLRPFSDEVFHAGDIGSATAVKLGGNLLLFAMMSGLAEALAFVSAHGADPGRLLAVVAKTGFRSPYFDVKGRQMIAGDYAPRFTIDNALKDLGLILEAAGETGLRLAATGAARGLFEAARAAGRGGDDTAAVFEAVRPSSERAGDGESQTTTKLPGQLP